MRAYYIRYVPEANASGRQNDFEFWSVRNLSVTPFTTLGHPGS